MTIVVAPPLNEKISATAGVKGGTGKDGGLAWTQTQEYKTHASQGPSLVKHPAVAAQAADHSANSTSCQAGPA